MYPRRNSGDDPELQRALAASLNNYQAVEDDFDGLDDFAYDEDAALARAMEESQRAAALSADVARGSPTLPVWARPTQPSPPMAAPVAPWRTGGTPREPARVEPWRQSFVSRSGSPPRMPSPHAIQDGVVVRTPTNSATLPLPEPRASPRPASIPVDGGRRVLVEPSLPSASQLIRNQNDEYQRAVEADLRARIQAEVERSQRMAAEAEAARRAAEEAQIEIRRAQEIQAARDAIQGPQLLPVDSLVDSSEVYSLTFIYPDGSRVPYSINRREPLASLFQLARYTLKHSGDIQLLIPGVARLVERAGDEVDRRPLVDFATIGPRTLMRVLPQ